MSFWMTSGASRLRAKQGRTFGARAQRRAASVAADALVNSAAPTATTRSHCRRKRRSAEVSLESSSEQALSSSTAESSQTNGEPAPQTSKIMSFDKANKRGPRRILPGHHHFLPNRSAPAVAPVASRGAHRGGQPGAGSAFNLSQSSVGIDNGNMQRVLAQRQLLLQQQEADILNAASLSSNFSPSSPSAAALLGLCQSPGAGGVYNHALAEMERRRLLQLEEIRVREELLVREQLLLQQQQEKEAASISEARDRERDQFLSPFHQMDEIHARQKQRMQEVNQPQAEMDSKASAASALGVFGQQLNADERQHSNSPSPHHSGTVKSGYHRSRSMPFSSRTEQSSGVRSRNSQRATSLDMTRANINARLPCRGQHLDHDQTSSSREYSVFPELSSGVGIAKKRGSDASTGSATSTTSKSNKRHRKQEKTLKVGEVGSNKRQVVDLDDCASDSVAHPINQAEAAAGGGISRFMNRATGPKASPRELSEAHLFQTGATHRNADSSFERGMQQGEHLGDGSEQHSSASVSQKSQAVNTTSRRVSNLKETDEQAKSAVTNMAPSSVLRYLNGVEGYGEHSQQHDSVSVSQKSQAVNTSSRRVSNLKETDEQAKSTVTDVAPSSVLRYFNNGVDGYGEHYQQHDSVSMSQKSQAVNTTGRRVSNLKETDQQAKSTVTSVAPSSVLRYFNNGVEVDVNGVPIVSPCTEEDRQHATSTPQKKSGQSTQYQAKVEVVDSTNQVSSSRSNASEPQSIKRSAVREPHSSRSPAQGGLIRDVAPTKAATEKVAHTSPIPNIASFKASELTPPLPKSCTLTDLLSYVRERVPELNTTLALIQQRHDSTKMGPRSGSAPHQVAVDAALRELYHIVEGGVVDDHPTEKNMSHSVSASPASYNDRLRMRTSNCIRAIEAYKRGLDIPQNSDSVDAVGVGDHEKSVEKKPAPSPCQPPEKTDGTSDISSQVSSPLTGPSPPTVTKDEPQQTQAPTTQPKAPEQDSLKELQEHQSQIWSLFSQQKPEDAEAPRRISSMSADYDSVRRRNSGMKRARRRSSAMSISSAGPHADLIGEIFGTDDMPPKVVDPTPSALSADPSKIAEASVEDLVRDSLKEREKTLSAASVLMGFMKAGT